MRRIISLLAAVVLCFSLALHAYAWDFVPSISYKPTPELDGATLVTSGETEIGEENLDIYGCIVVTSIIQAKEKTTDIEQEARDELLEVYAKLNDGAMDMFAIPEEYFQEQDSNAPALETHTNMGMSYENKNYVVIQLVDVSFAKRVCIDVGHDHWEVLEREDVNATLDFDLGVTKDETVVVLHFHNGQWLPVEKVTNNGDGTVTCVFEHFCPVAFCVEKEILEEPQQAAADYSWLLWLVVLVACAVTVAVLGIYREKDKKKRNHTKA